MHTSNAKRMNTTSRIRRSNPIGLLVLLVFCLTVAFGQHGAVAQPTFDTEKAEAFGADEYGMKSYVFAFLKRGPNRDRPKEEAAELQRAHLQNIVRLAEMGKLVLAGPFLDDTDIRGIYIFNVETVEEAQALVETDPAIQAGSLVMELRPWYGSAALVGVNDVHKTLSKTDIADP